MLWGFSNYIKMKTFKKYLRRSGFILMIILASFGIALVGGVPIPFNRKGDSFKTPIELVEIKDEDSEKEAELFEKNS